MEKQSERFTRAINALVQAYLNDTLAKGLCAACAVGNIVAAGIGVKITRVNENYCVWNTHFYPSWNGVFVTRRGVQKTSEDAYYGKAKVEIDSTGYTWQELAKVEAAFESNTNITSLVYCLHTPEQIDADQYAGLMAVVDVLCEIEGIGDATEYKALFAKA